MADILSMIRKDIYNETLILVIQGFNYAEVIGREVGKAPAGSYIRLQKLEKIGLLSPGSRGKNNIQYYVVNWESLIEIIADQIMENIDQIRNTIIYSLKYSKYIVQNSEEKKKSEAKIEVEYFIELEKEFSNLNRKWLVKNLKKQSFIRIVEKIVAGYYIRLKRIEIPISNYPKIEKVLLQLLDTMKDSYYSGIMKKNGIDIFDKLNKFSELDTIFINSLAIALKDTVNLKIPFYLEPALEDYERL